MTKLHVVFLTFTQYYWDDQIKVNKMRTHDIRNAFKDLLGKPEGNRPHGIYVRRCDENILKYLILK
jgi:hypothetical protein